MSLYALTFQQLKDEAEHAIGSAPDSRTSSDRIVNGALEYLCTRHPWSWRYAITTLSFVQNVGQLVLPADFGQLIDLVGNKSPQTAVRKATLEQIVRIRVYGQQGDASLLYRLGMAAPANAQTIPARILEVAPMPAASLVDALYLTYRKLIPTLVGGTDVPAIPYGMHELLRWLVRGFSKLTTTGDGGADMTQFERMLPDYIAQDTLDGGPREGTMANVVEDLNPDGIFRLAPHLSIAMPGDP